MNEEEKKITLMTDDELYFVRVLHDGLTDDDIMRLREEAVRLKKLARRKHPPYIIKPKDDEVYKDVVGYPNYEVSNYGNVRNKIKGENLKPTLTQYGYYRVGLWNDKQLKMHLVHRLVGMAFLGNSYKEGLEINHKDGNKLNNHVSNLEWCTGKENVRHAYKNGLIKFTDETGRKHREAFRRMYPAVRCVENGKVYPDAKVAAKDLKVGQREIRQVMRGCYRTHKGYHFEKAKQSEVNFYGQEQ